MKSWLFICNDERRAALKPLCEEGLSVPEIARRLGTYKGSVSNFLSVNARDLQALRSERAAARLDGVVADGRAKMMIAREPAPSAAMEPDRLTGLESSVAALSATVGEVLDVVRGIAARMDGRALVRLPDAVPGPADASGLRWGSDEPKPLAQSDALSAPRNRGGRKPVWTDEHIDTIRRLAAEGRTDAEISHAIGATNKDTVRGLRKRHGIRSTAAPAPRAPRPPPKRSFWTDERVDQLRTLAGDGKTDAEIIAAMGLAISCAAVKDARKRYGIKSGVKQTMPDRLAEIRRMAGEGMTDEEIATALGDRTHWTVAKLRYRHKIPAGSSQTTKATVWTEERVAELRRLAGEGLSDAAVVEAMGLEMLPGSVKNIRKKHGIPAGGRQGGGRAWSDEAIAEVRKLATDGLSTREITDRLGGKHSRSAIIGLCHREGIKLGQAHGGQRKEPAQPKQAASARGERSSPAPRRASNIAVFARPKNLDIRSAPKPLPRSAPVARPMRPKSLPEIVPATAVGLLDLDGKQCRFPVAESPDVIGRHLFCAADTGDLAESYCPHHRFRCTSGAVYGGLRDAERAPGRAA
jgi:hypothetical protein